MINKALALAARGISVFPCKETIDQDTGKISKKPYTDHGFTAPIRSGFKDASTDPAVITAWWKQWPNALLGTPTGIKFVVLDCDLQHASAQEWYAKANLPVTRIHLTHSGGRHLFFKPRADFKCSASKIWPKIDTRGANDTGEEGGYIIWWPASGFDVLHGNAFAEVPEWLMRQLNPPAPLTVVPFARKQLRSDKDLEPIIRVILRAREGERNTATFWAACRLAEHVHSGQVSQGDMVGIIVEAAGRTGLTHAEARSIANSALRKVRAS